jgi:NADPH:quinone reductase-like Zn-dependent oxidoreductase
MKLRYKIGGGLLGTLVLAIGVLAIVLSYESDCVPMPQIADGATTMKAAIYRCYGSAEVIEVVDLEKPVPSADEVLVRVHAASVNPLDWHYMRGSPYFMRLGAGIGAPEDIRMGVDFSGVVEAIGENVQRFKPGDAVFGGRSGAFAEYVLVPESRALAHKPDNISFEQAAAVPIAALTALQALRDKGNVKAGQKVLINGASGGVGTFAVQIAHASGADVTGVCSARNIELVRSLGADHVIDYKTDDYTELGEQYDLIIDMVGNHSPSENQKAMTPYGTLVVVGGAKGDWIAPMIQPLKAMIYGRFVDQEFKLLLARMNQDDLQYLSTLMEQGDVTPVIDRRYAFSGLADAVRYSEDGHASGKIIVSIP